MKPRVLITRPRDEAEAFANSLAAAGYDTLIDPLLSVEDVEVNLDGINSLKAIITTSPQAFRADMPAAWRNIPVFTMGQASENRAKQAGMTTCVTVQGDVEELVAAVRSYITAGAPLLYLRGETIRHDLKEKLPDYRLSEKIVYRTIEAPALSPATIEMLDQGLISVVTFFSPRTAEIFTKLVKEARMEASLMGIKALCLSPAVLDSIRDLPWQRVETSDSPNQIAVLAVLKQWTGLSDE